MRSSRTLLMAVAVWLAFSPVPGYASGIDDVQELLEKGRLREAMALAERGVAAEPKSADAHGALGEVRFELSQLDAACESFARATELAPSSWAPRANSYLARVAFYYAEDDTVRAVLPRLDPKSWVAHRLRFLIDPPGLSATRSKHYLVYTDDGLLKRTGRAYAAKVMDLVHDAYTKVFPFKVDKRIVSRVFIFSDTLRFQAFSKRATGDSKSDSVGYYSPSTRILVINADPDGAPINPFGFTAEALDTMFHEAFHQFMRLHAPNVPAWFNEGLAEYFGPSRIVGAKKLVVGVIVRTDPGGSYTRYERIKRVIRGQGDHRYVPLKRFLQLTDEEFRANGRSHLHYAEAWSVIHFLLNAKSMRGVGKKLIKRYFATLRAGGTRDEAYAKTFGKLNLKEVERLWLDYVRRF